MNLQSKRALPEKLEVNGASYKINTDFRLGIQFDLLTHDRSLDKRTIAVKQLLLYYGMNLPEDVNAAYKALVRFIGGGETERRGRKGGNDLRVVDYDGDAKLIYAAFLDQYRIDLDEADLHWWKFRAMLAGLREDHRISKIMQYRAMKPGDIKNKEYRRHVMKMKKLYAIRAKFSEVDLEEMAGRAF